MLSLQNLPEAARHEHIFLKLKSGSLLSVSKLFDKGCTVNFTADQVSVNLDKQTHPYNNAIIDSGTTGHSPQATIAWMNPKLTK